MKILIEVEVPNAAIPENIDLHFNKAVTLMNATFKIITPPGEEEKREILKECFENRELDYRYITSKIESAIFHAIDQIFGKGGSQ